MPPAPLIDEKELLSRLRDGDQHAFSAIYNHYHDFLLAFAYKLSADEDESMDIVQDIFVSLWTNREKLEIYSKLLTYLYQAVRYGFLQRQRRKNTDSAFVKAFQQALVRGANPIEEHLLEKELAVRLERLASSLPGKMGQVFLMTHFQQFDLEEIAQALNISKKTTKNLLALSVKNIKIRLGLAMLMAMLLP